MQNKHLSEKFVVAGGFRTRFLEGGRADAPLVVLLHDGGFGGSAHTSWDGVAPGLVEAGYRVRVPDMLGFGGTDKVHFFDRSPAEYRAKHIEDFCATLGLSGVHFVGTSFGGTLLMRALATNPVTWPFASACSIGGTGGPWRVAEVMAKFAEYDGSVESLDKNLISFLADRHCVGFDFDSYLKKRHAQSLVPGHYAALAAARLKAPWEQGGQSTQADAYPNSLKGCTVPLLLVEATEDPTCQPNWPQKIQEVVPAAQIRKIPGLHTPNVDRPGVVLDVLLGWLKRNHVE